MPMRDPRADQRPGQQTSSQCELPALLRLAACEKGAGMRRAAATAMGTGRGTYASFETSLISFWMLPTLKGEISST